MSNYWLSEYANTEVKDTPPEEEDPEDMEDSSGSDSDESPSDKLNDRQSMMYDYYENVVDEFGMFDQSSLANGAHYAPAAKNPFIKEGLVCSNCVYFMGGQACEIVSGTIEPNAICKLWIIPEELLTIKK